MSDLVSIHIAAWLACAAFLVVLANGSFKLIDRFTGRKTDTVPQPFVVQEHAAFATKAELDRHAAEDQQEMQRIEDKVDLQGEKLSDFRDEVRANGDHRRASIEGKVEAARTEARVHNEKLREHVDIRFDRLSVALAELGGRFEERKS